MSMDIKIIINSIIRAKRNKVQSNKTPTAHQNRCDQDIYFTSNFHAKANEWGLTEGHARLVYYEGDIVKENMKVMTYKGEEIGIYVFHDRETNQPVVTSIWKRRPRGKNPPAHKTRR